MVGIGNHDTPCREIASGGVRIPLNLRLQGHQRLEALLRADIVHKINFNLLTVEIAPEVEQMHFQLLADTPHRGPAPHIGDPRPWL